MIDKLHIDSSLGDGIFFDRDAYAGCLSRLMVIIVDSIVLNVAGVAIWVPLVMLLWDPKTGRTPDALFLVLWIAVIWFYLTVIKRSRLRTIGYRLAGLQIVTTNGARPTVAAMTFRLLLWIFGPFNFVLDFVWLGADPERQTLRDCYACTYVVRANARPSGDGPIHLTRYFAAGLAPSYPRVIRPTSEPEKRKPSR